MFNSGDFEFKIKVWLYDMYGKYVDSCLGEEYYKGNMKVGKFSVWIIVNFDLIMLLRNVYVIFLL